MHIFREDASSIDQLSEKQKDNRSRFITFCQENGFVICNTWYQKSLSKLVTYRNVAAPNFQGPYTTDRYAQLDYVLINQRWKNCIQNVETNDQHAVSTDHKLLVAEAKVKLAKRKKAHVCSHPKFREPSELQIQEFNKLVTEKVHTQNFPLSQDPFAEWAIYTHRCRLDLFYTNPTNRENHTFSIRHGSYFVPNNARMNKVSYMRLGRRNQNSRSKSVKIKGNTYKHSLRKWMNTDTDGQESSV